MFRMYRLIGHGVVECHDLKRWARWFDTAACQVAETFVDEFRVSTVFLGVDHNHFESGPPILFETMVFGPRVEMKIFGKIKMMSTELDFQPRCSTWEQALVQHKRICSEVSGLIVSSEVATALAISRAKVERE